MKHLTFADKSLLVGDTTANLIMEYASQLALHQTADTITIAAIGADGNDVTATMLLDAGAPIMIETATTGVSEPDNADVDSYMVGQISRYVNPTPASSLDDHELNLPLDWQS
jgi:hypothetical protein